MDFFQYSYSVFTNIVWTYYHKKWKTILRKSKIIKKGKINLNSARVSTTYALLFCKTLLIKNLEAQNSKCLQYYS